MILSLVCLQLFVPHASGHSLSCQIMESHLGVPHSPRTQERLLKYYSIEYFSLLAKLYPESGFDNLVLEAMLKRCT